VLEAIVHSRISLQAQCYRTVSHWRKENVVACLFISALSYWGAGVSGIDGTTLTAG
jgi:hypothetical protein